MSSVAGSVTVATSIGAILFYIIKNPKVYNRLTDEIRENHRKLGKLGTLGYADIQRMSYL